MLGAQKKTHDGFSVGKFVIVCSDLVTTAVVQAFTGLDPFLIK